MKRTRIKNRDSWRVETWDWEWNAISSRENCWSWRRRKCEASRDESELIDLGKSLVQEEVLADEKDEDYKDEDSKVIDQGEKSELIDLSKSLVLEEVMADREDNEDEVNEDSEVFDLWKSQLIDLGEVVTEEPELLELGRSLSQQDLPPVNEEEEMNIIDSYTEDNLINLESFETPNSSLKNDGRDSDSDSDSGWSTDNSQEATA